MVVFELGLIHGNKWTTVFKNIIVLLVLFFSRTALDDLQFGCKNPIIGVVLVLFTTLGSFEIEDFVYKGDIRAVEVGSVLSERFQASRMVVESFEIDFFHLLFVALFAVKVQAVPHVHNSTPLASNDEWARDASSVSGSSHSVYRCSVMSLR